MNVWSALKYLIRPNFNGTLVICYILKNGIENKHKMNEVAYYE